MLLHKIKLIAQNKSIIEKVLRTLHKSEIEIYITNSFEKVLTENIFFNILIIEGNEANFPLVKELSLQQNVVVFVILEDSNTDKIKWLKAGVANAISENDISQLKFFITHLLKRSSGISESVVYLVQKNNELNERLKELTCLYKTLDTLSQAQNIDDVFTEIVHQIPGAFQYPDILVSRIKYKNKIYETAPEEISPWAIIETIHLNDEISLTLEVFYKIKMPFNNNSPFLDEERLLIRKIIQQIETQIRYRKLLIDYKNYNDFNEAIINSLPGTFYLFDKDLNFLKWNNEVVKVTGYSHEELAQLKLSNFFDEVEIDRINKKIEELLEGNSITVETKLLVKSGEKIPFMCTAFPFEMNGEKYILGIGLDITERVEIEKAILEKEERLSLALRGGNLGLWDWNLVTGEIIHNEIWAEQLGFDLMEIENNSIYDQLIHPEDLPKAYNEISRLLNGERESYEIRIRMKTKSGKYKWILDKGKIFEWDEFGNPVRVTGTHTDISDLKQVEDELILLTHELKLNNHELEQFAYVTAHNLRSPVANLLGFMSLYNKEAITDELNKNLFDKMERCVNQLNNTLHDLIDIVANKNQKPEIKKVNLKEILQNVVLELEDKIINSGAIIQEEFRSDEAVDFNNTHLHSIFFNLISNSIKYKSPERIPLISFNVKNEGEYTCIRASDNGIGIDLLKYKSKVFKMYQRFHTHEPDGKGLGLYLIKNHVESLGGRVEVESEIDKGTTFYIYLKNHLKQEIYESA